MGARPPAAALPWGDRLPNDGYTLLLAPSAASVRRWPHSQQLYPPLQHRLPRLAWVPLIHIPPLPPMPPLPPTLFPVAAVGRNAEDPGRDEGPAGCAACREGSGSAIASAPATGAPLQPTSFSRNRRGHHRFWSRPAAGWHACTMKPSPRPGCSRHRFCHRRHWCHGALVLAAWL